jgi:hypothetical protein
VFDGDLLDRKAHFQLFRNRLLLVKGSVKACSANSRQLAHSLDT